MRKLAQLRAKLTEELKQLSNNRHLAESESKTSCLKAEESFKEFGEYEAKIVTLMNLKQSNLREELSTKFLKEEQGVHRAIDSLRLAREDMRDCQRQLTFLQNLLEQGKLKRY